MAKRAIMKFGVLCGLFIGLIGFGFFVPYLPSVPEKVFFSIYFPAIVALLFVGLSFFYKGHGGPVVVKIKNGDAGDNFVGSYGVLKYLLLVLIMSFLIGSSSQGVMVLPTLIFGRPTMGKEIIKVSSINGFRTVYNNTVWVSFGNGFFARKFLWDKRDLQMKHIGVGSSVRVVGKSLGAGIEVSDIFKVELNKGKKGDVAN
jgi:hypothetical protein